jgi:hypothetical protein
LDKSQVASYGGMLKFSILYYARQDVEGEGYFDVDCELFVSALAQLIVNI